jgi:hypothetical protein
MLCGLWSMTLASFFLKEGGEIFLLGFDFGAIDRMPDGKAKTHFYQDNLYHPGVGQNGTYKERRLNFFSPYKELKDLKIYNVSLNSKISYFDKISYDQFFDKLNGEVNQNHLRNQMVEQLKVLPGYYF